jgi:hypothetical protein
MSAIAEIDVRPVTRLFAALADSEVVEPSLSNCHRLRTPSFPEPLTRPQS